MASSAGVSLTKRSLTILPTIAADISVNVTLYAVGTSSGLGCKKLKSAVVPEAMTMKDCR